MTTPHRRLVTAATRRQVRANNRVQAIADRMAVIVRRHLRTLLRTLPDPSPMTAHQTAAHVRAAVLILARELAPLLARGLTATARWGHARTAALLTARVAGRLPVRRVRVAREGPFDDPADDYESWLIDPPEFDVIRRLVGPAPDELTRLLDPQDAADVVWQTIAAGGDRRAMAADLERLFGGYEGSARRIARTEGLRVATAAQLTASEQIADLIPAYQVLSVGDERVRPEHRKRHGTIYYRNPGPGQLGFDVMPQPPIDMPGSRLAHNCRCFIIPVLQEDDVEPWPDPGTMAPWFDGASAADRRAVAGGDRLAAARAALGREPSWLDLIDRTGELLPVEAFA